MQKLIVFGGTGKSGKAILRTALERKDLAVSIFVRSPWKIPDELRKGLNIIEGDVLDQKLVTEAIKSQDFVISALGKGMNLASTTLISCGTHNIIEGMRANQVSNLMVVSVSTELSKDYLTPFFLKAVCADHKRMLAELTTCTDLQWCAVCVPEIYELPYTGDYKVAIDKRPGPLSVVGMDMADFMISCIGDEEKWAKYKQAKVGITTDISMSTLSKTWQFKAICIITSSFVAFISYAIYKLF